jgi:uncharacterized protein (TIGR03435 family)
LKLFLLSFAPLLALSQTAPAPLAFEAASVKPAPAPTGQGLRVSISQDKGRLTMSNVSLRTLLLRAYKTKDPQLVAPDWMADARFDIVATLPAGATSEQVPAMLQTLLADRFKVTIHKDSKVMPVYALVVAKGGPKLKEAEGDTQMSVDASPRGRKMTGKTTMDLLCDSLSNMLDRPVNDATELKGTYELDLTWTPEDTDRRGLGPGRAPEGSEAHPNDSPDAPSIFVALQEKMGLKLESRKAPAAIIVVDNAEKVPTEN